MKFVLITATVVVLFMAACKSENAVVQTPTGKFFNRNCAVCHGQKGEGKRINGLLAPALTNGRALTDSDARLTQQIANGGGGMPAFKYSLTDGQVQELVRFIREDVQRGKAAKR